MCRSACAHDQVVVSDVQLKSTLKGFTQLDLIIVGRISDYKHKYFTKLVHWMP